MTSKKQKRKERAMIRELKSKDPYRRKDLTEKDISFNNRYTTVHTTMDVKKFLKEHVVWCYKCNSRFTGMLMHAKTSDNKKLMADCIIESKKLWEKKE